MDSLSPHAAPIHELALTEEEEMSLLEQTMQMLIVSDERSGSALQKTREEFGRFKEKMEQEIASLQRENSGLKQQKEEAERNFLRQRETWELFFAEDAVKRGEQTRMIQNEISALQQSGRAASEAIVSALNTARYIPHSRMSDGIARIKNSGDTLKERAMGPIASHLKLLDSSLQTFKKMQQELISAHADANADANADVQIHDYPHFSQAIGYTEHERLSALNLNRNPL